MGLAIDYQCPHDEVGNLISGEPSWVVFGDHLPPCGPVVFVYGFGRRLDAEIAIKAMRQLPIDWDAEYAILKPQWSAYGGRAAVMKHICNHLQW